jgi:uncharacterized protein
MYQGSDFPCLTDCPEVMNLPQMKVVDYLKGQQANQCEVAQDAYLDLMKSLVDGAFSMLIDSGLAATGDQETLTLWHLMGQESPEALIERLGAEWIDRLMTKDRYFLLTNNYLQLIILGGKHGRIHDVEFAVCWRLCID